MSHRAKEILDPRNAVSDRSLDQVLKGDILWVLQANLVMKDLRSRHKPFTSNHTTGILYKGVVISLGYDRSDAFLQKDDSPKEIRQRESDYRTRRAAEIKMNIRRLHLELRNL